VLRRAVDQAKLGRTKNWRRCADWTTSAARLRLQRPGVPSVRRRSRSCNCRRPAQACPGLGRTNLLRLCRATATPTAPPLWLAPPITREVGGVREIQGLGFFKLARLGNPMRALLPLALVVLAACDGGSGTMKPGQDCLSCHKPGGEKPWTLAGTVFPTATSVTNQGLSAPPSRLPTPTVRR